MKKYREKQRETDTCEKTKKNEKNRTKKTEKDKKQQKKPHKPAIFDFKSLIISTYHFYFKKNLNKHR